jgi:hypothetical protein
MPRRAGCPKPAASIHDRGITIAYCPSPFRPDQQHQRQSTDRQDQHQFEVVDIGDGTGLPRDLLI